jgi:hypothetical protein
VAAFTAKHEMQGYLRRRLSAVEADRGDQESPTDQIVDVLSVSLLIRCIVLPFLIAAAARGTEQNGYGPGRAIVQRFFRQPG